MSALTDAVHAFEGHSRLRKPAEAEVEVEEPDRVASQFLHRPANSEDELDVNIG